MIKTTKLKKATYFIIACTLFTAMLEILCFKRGEIFTNDYPPVVVDKLRDLNIVGHKPPTKKSDIIRKLIAVLVYAILFAVVLRFINGITTFLKATLTAYLLWLVVTILLVPFEKIYKKVLIKITNRYIIYLFKKHK